MLNNGEQWGHILQCHIGSVLPPARCRPSWSKGVRSSVLVARQANSKDLTRDPVTLPLGPVYGVRFPLES